MISPRVWRPLALAGVLGATLGAATAAAQTVVVRGVPAGSTAELVQDGAAASSGAPNQAGDAILTGNLADRADVRVNIYVDVCPTVRRVTLIARDAVPAAAQAGCERTAVPGVFVIRSISTIVVNLTGSIPTVLLRQGPFDLRPPREWARAPTGLVIFGGGGWSRLHRAREPACATIEECPGKDSGVAYTGGMAYWLTPYLAAEASYVRPADVLFEGVAGTALFRSSVETHVLMLTGKIGVPIGPVRIFGLGGATYHQARVGTIQDSADGIEDRFEMRTAGWGWTFGGGFEAWVAPRVAIYGEGGRAALKGTGVETGGEGSLDERMTFLMFGLRISLSR